MIRTLTTPITEDMVSGFAPGDLYHLSGELYCGRDAVLPRVVKALEKTPAPELRGSAVFHTAVSIAGVGPTSSSKPEIEASIAPLSAAGVKLHIGKGRLRKETIEALAQFHCAYAVIPPVTALLGERMLSAEIVGYAELGMEAFYRIRVRDYPIILAAVHGRSIYERQ